MSNGHPYGKPLCENLVGDGLLYVPKIKNRLIQINKSVLGLLIFIIIIKRIFV